MKAVILKPRLDCSFKQGYVPKEIGPPNHPVRIHWQKFHEILEKTLKDLNVEVVTIHKPLWQMSPEDAKQHDPDIVFVPHKHLFEFCVEGPRVFYYMQMAFPELFSVDPIGWCAGRSNWPRQYTAMKETIDVFDEYRERALRGESKFQQTNSFPVEKLPEKFIFFPCQIPHDLTIKYHSDVSVADALRSTLDIGEKLDIPVVVKGHPMNPSSMTPLRNLFLSHENDNNIWLDEINVHVLLERCEAVFTVNSGVGLEAILHKKPVFTFGRADYDSYSLAPSENLWSDRYKNVDKAEIFINNYVADHCNTKDESFKLIEDIVRWI